MATMNKVFAIDSLRLMYRLLFAKGMKTFSKSNPLALWKVIMFMRRLFSLKHPYPLPRYCIGIPFISKCWFIASKFGFPCLFIRTSHSGFPALRRT